MEGPYANFGFILQSLTELWDGSTSMKIALLSDIHHNPVDAPPKICSSAIQLMREVINFVNQYPFDAVVDLGDRIDDRGRDEDLSFANQVAHEMRCFKPTREHLMGNHDSYSLSTSDWEALLERPLSSRAFLIDEYRLIFFAPI